MAQNEIVEVSATSNDRKTNRRKHTITNRI